MAFDLDDFVTSCRSAVAMEDPTAAVKELLERAVHAPSDVDAALPTTRAELAVLYESDDLTIMKAVWSPKMTLPPHNHRMWAVIGVYGGLEENHYFRRHDERLDAAGGRDLAAGEVAILGREVIHAVANPRQHSFTGAIHVYGGDFMHQPRSVWPGDPPTEEPATGATMQQYFERANLVGES
jgi:predicted metal-dependent enzyme (double-stranded beta helix superfamily)